MTVERVENSNGGSSVDLIFDFCNHRGGLQTALHLSLFPPCVTVMNNSSAEVGRPDLPILPLRDQRYGDGLHWTLPEGRRSRCQGHQQRGRQRWGRPRGHWADGQRNGGTEEGLWTDLQMGWGGGYRPKPWTWIRCNLMTHFNVVSRTNLSLIGLIGFKKSNCC